MKTRTLLAAPALVLASLLAGGRAGAQERIFVRAEPGTPVVAVEVLVAAGPADELKSVERTDGVCPARPIDN